MYIIRMPFKYIVDSITPKENIPKVAIMAIKNIVF